MPTRTPDELEADDWAALALTDADAIVRPDRDDWLIHDREVEYSVSDDPRQTWAERRTRRRSPGRE